MQPSSWASLAASLLIFGSGCDSTNCNVDRETNPPADYTGGRLVTTANSATFYETSAPDGQHLNYSAGAQYRIYHQLGARPLLVQPWVSFSATGTNGGNEAIPAGNMAEVIEVTDKYILIRNDSCGDYWLRVVAAFPEAK